MKRTRREALALCVAAAPAWAGLGSKDARYVGGTWSDIKEGEEGRIDTSGDVALRFAFDRKKPPREVRYQDITSLEYGQKAGRRIGATIGWGVTTMGLAALPMLLSKKRKHFLSIGFTAENGATQGIVLELGKDITRGTLKAVEARSGQKIEYESEDARKNVGN